MFRISTIDRESQRQLVLEGQLIAPCTDALRNAYRTAKTNLNGRELVIDVDGVTAISNEGEETLFELMAEGARFLHGGTLTRHILKQLARRLHRNGPHSNQAGQENRK